MAKFIRTLYGFAPGGRYNGLMNAAEQTIESLSEEIGRIVAERQGLRAEHASPEALEENRRRLAAAQAQLSRLLIDRYRAAGEAA